VLPPLAGCGEEPNADLHGIHWAIVRGERGPSACPILPEWVDEIEAMCREAELTAARKSSSAPVVQFVFPDIAR